MWSDRRILDLLGVEHPIVQAPMAGAGGADLAVAVCEAGGLGSLPCALLTEAQARAELAVIRRRTARPINVNFFCHAAPPPNEERERAWRHRLAPYYAELGLDPAAAQPGAGRAAFDQAACALVEEARPEVVSFHFGLPERALRDRVRATGAKILSSATTVEEARWLEDQGCDAIIAQGAEAGGHRGTFLDGTPARQVGTMALVPQIVDAVKVPVIAAGGIADGRGIAAAAMLGAAAVQIGTAYLFCPEATISPIDRAALRAARDDSSVLTNLFTGRPARGIVNRFVRELGPTSDLAPEFPLASAAVFPLRAAAEARGSDDFTPLWSGQSARIARELPAGELTRRLVREALERLGERR